MSKFTILKSIIKADYEQKIKQYELINNPVSTILLGDSLIGYFPDEFIPKEFNQGIPGDTTIGVLNRLNLVARLNPKVIIIHIGSNDLVLTDLNESEIINNIKQIIQKLTDKLPNSKIYFLSIFPINENISNKSYLEYRDNEKIVHLNQLLQKTLLTDYYPIDHLFKDKNNQLKEEFTTDGLHLSQLGYQTFYELIKDLMGV